MASELPQSLPVSLIVVGRRLRPVDPVAVQNLQVAIQENNFFGAILVRPITGEEGEQRFELVAGAHRLAAMRGLGRPTIPAVVRPMSDDEARQIEIDENLVRRGLTPLERAEMVAERFSVWARRFPERVEAQGAKPKRGRPSNAAKFAELQGGVPATMGFTAETAADVGLSKRTVEAAWTTVSGLPADLRARLHGTWLAKNEGALRQLAAKPDREVQSKAVDLLLAGNTRSVADALTLASGGKPTTPVRTPVDDTLKAFKALWGKASPAAREAILHELAGKPLPGGWSLTEGGGG